MKAIQLGVICALLNSCSGVVSTLPDGGGEDAGPGVDAGSTPDAGSPDDAGIDAGLPPIDAGTPSDGGACPANAEFCESFENGLDAAKWITNGNAAAFSIDRTTPARDGTASLHLAYGVPYANTGHQTVEIKNPISAPDDRMYLRTYLRFGNLGLPGAHPAFLYVLGSNGNEQAFGSIINDFALLAWTPGGLDNARIWYEGGGNQWHPGVEDGDATPTTENGLTAQTWICVEMMFFGDHQFAGDTMHPNEETKVWINGAEIPQMNATDALWRQELGHDPPEHWSPDYQDAHWRFGVESFGPANVALDLWFDGIVLSHSPIGCL